MHAKTKSPSGFSAAVTGNGNGHNRKRRGTESPGNCRLSGYRTKQPCMKPCWRERKSVMNCACWSKGYFPQSPGRPQESTSAIPTAPSTATFPPSDRNIWCTASAESPDRTFGWTHHRCEDGPEHPRNPLSRGENHTGQCGTGAVRHQKNPATMKPAASTGGCPYKRMNDNEHQ